MPTPSNDFFAFLAEAFASEGFVVCCAHFADGERFTIYPRDEATALTLLFEYDIDVYAPLREFELRIKLAHVGLSTDVIEARIQLARAWRERIAKHYGPEVRFSH
jgi:hypothetical protein